MKTVLTITIGSILGVSIAMLINSIFGVSSLTGSLVKLILGIGIFTFATIYLKK